MVPQELDISFVQGSPWRASLQWDLDDQGTPKPLVDYVFRMQVRKKYADEDTLGPYVDIDSENKGGITVNEQTGTVAIVVPSSVTELIPKGGYVWDLEFVPPGDEPDKLYRGKVTVTPEVTRG